MIKQKSGFSRQNFGPLSRQKRRVPIVMSCVHRQLPEN